MGLKLSLGECGSVVVGLGGDVDEVPSEFWLAGSLFEEVELYS